MSATGRRGVRSYRKGTNTLPSFEEQQAAALAEVERIEAEKLEAVRRNRARQVARLDVEDFMPSAERRAIARAA